MTKRASRVIVIGDAIVDLLEAPDGSLAPHAGGASLNLAVGVVRLGGASALLTNLGHDRNGYWLRSYLRTYGVEMIVTPFVDFTGVASSRRIDGEPTYSFNPALHRRRYSFPAAVMRQIVDAPVLVSNSFPLDNVHQAKLLSEVFQQATGLRVIDPNPRATLIDDLAQFRNGFESVARFASLVKMSEEDANLLYGASVETVSRRLLELGVTAVLMTKRAQGATYLNTYGLRIDSPIANMAGPIIDTMGAGDATLAAILIGVLETGLNPTHDVFQRLLAGAMRVAAATARANGGMLQVPDKAQPPVSRGGPQPAAASPCRSLTLRPYAE